MAILRPTEIYGRAEFLGVNSNRDAGLRTASLPHIKVGQYGFDGEAHGGATRPSCVRVKLQYAPGTEIFNVRQVTVVSTEEMAEMGDAMGLPEPVAPEWVAANLMLSGIPDLTRVPPSSRLIFEGGVSLVVDMENEPCSQVAREIEAAHPGLGMTFPSKAMRKRGVTAFVERAGEIELGERCRLHIPLQRHYEHADKK